MVAWESRLAHFRNYLDPTLGAQNPAFSYKFSLIWLHGYRLTRLGILSMMDLIPKFFCGYAETPEQVFLQFFVILFLFGLLACWLAGLFDGTKPLKP